MEFIIYNSLGKKSKLKISNVQVALIDCVSVDAEYNGLSTTNTLLSYGGGHTKPFIRFEKDKGNHVDAVLTKTVIEYLWKQIGSPYSGLLYGYTKNYEANWCD